MWSRGTSEDSLEDLDAGQVGSHLVIRQPFTGRCRRGTGVTGGGALIGGWALLAASAPLHQAAFRSHGGHRTGFPKGPDSFQWLPAACPAGHSFRDRYGQGHVSCRSYVLNLGRLPKDSSRCFHKQGCTSRKGHLVNADVRCSFRRVAVRTFPSRICCKTGRSGPHPASHCRITLNISYSSCIHRL